MKFDLSKKTPEQIHNEQVAGTVAFCFFATCPLHLVPLALFGFLFLITRSKNLLDIFTTFFGLIQLFYMFPLILHCRLRNARPAMAGFILGAALTFELGCPIAGFGLVCAAP